MARANTSIFSSHIGGLASKQHMHFDIAPEDRISNFPDSILSHILSFLPTELSVRTSCLSKRWRQIWTLVSVLHICDNIFDLDNPPRKRKKHAEDEDSFEKFMNKVLILSSHIHVKKFRLLLFSDYKTSVFNSWIRAAVMHNIEELDLCTTRVNKLPMILYNSATLVLLKLKGAMKLNVPEIASLPSLKVVHLLGVYDLCDADINRLLSASPVLQELLIEAESWQVSKRYAVRSSSLKTLIMRYSDWFQHYHYQVVIDAPKLEYLEFTDPLNEGVDIEIKNTTSIVKATLILSGMVCCDLSEFRALASSLWNLCNVKALSVPSSALKAALSNKHDICFNNLTKLVMSYCAADLSILPQILKRVPNLEVLVLKELSCCEHTVKCEAWIQENTQINCLNHTLKTLQLEGFKGNEAEMSILEYFMENATVLNEVRTSNGLAKKEESEKALLKKLLTFPRCSNAFKIIIS